MSSNGIQIKHLRDTPVTSKMDRSHQDESLHNQTQTASN